jgi:hypothetical protein
MRNLTNETKDEEKEVFIIQEENNIQYRIMLLWANKVEIRASRMKINYKRSSGC